MAVVEVATGSGTKNGSEVVAVDVATEVEVVTSTEPPPPVPDVGGGISGVDVDTSGVVPESVEVVSGVEVATPSSVEVASEEIVCEGSCTGVVDACV